MEQTASGRAGLPAGPGGFVMSDKKIVFLDVDGTLVDYNGDLPDSAVQAVRAARQALEALCGG